MEVTRVVVLAAVMLFGLDEATHRAPQDPPPACNNSGNVCVGDPISGTVTKVNDGDGLTVKAHRLRLANIDAPESKQPFGEQARAILASLVLGKPVTAYVTAIDQYDRPVALVRLDADPGIPINTVMVQAGAAQVYTRYNSDPALAAVQEEAKATKSGLWALPRDEQVEPWLWRACQRGPVADRLACLAAAPRPRSRP